MKSKAHGKKCQTVGLSESSLDEPESEETGTSEDGNAARAFFFSLPPWGAMRVHLCEVQRVEE